MGGESIQTYSSAIWLTRVSLRLPSPQVPYVLVAHPLLSLPPRAATLGRSRLARISPGTIAAVEMLLASDTRSFPASACLYNPENAIFPREPPSSPPRARNTRTREGVGASMATSVDPCTPAGRVPAGRFRSFIEKSVGKRKALVTTSSSSSLAGRWRVGKRPSKMAHSGGKEGAGGRNRPPGDPGREKLSISPSEMTIRRGWLGKRLFIARDQGSSSSLRLTSPTSPNLMKRGTRRRLRKNRNALPRCLAVSLHVSGYKMHVCLERFPSSVGTTPRRQTSRALIDRGESVTILFTRVSTRRISRSLAAPSDT